MKGTLDIEHDERYRTLTNWSTISCSDGYMSTAPKKRTRIQAQNEKLIVAAALQVFSANGFRGSTVEQIARKSGMSKANILYYFRSKTDIYLAVLEHTLSIWLDPLKDLDPNGDPMEQIWSYTKAKLVLSQNQPEASRLFANEILHGAPMIAPFLKTELKALVDEKCAVIQSWIDQGKIAALHPLHLIFFIWSSTQHYADFAAQIQILSIKSDDRLFSDAEATLKTMLFGGLRVPSES